MGINRHSGGERRPQKPAGNKYQLGLDSIGLKYDGSVFEGGNDAKPGVGDFGMVGANTSRTGCKQ